MKKGKVFLSSTYLSFIGLALILIIFTSGCKPNDITDKSNGISTDIENFKPIKESFIDYDFEVDEEEDSFIVNGQYDLNRNGNKDRITIVLQRGFDKKVDCYIEINGTKKEIDMDYTEDGEAWLIDLDDKDSFTEIAVFDEGPSGDPNYHIYRYDGKEIYYLGSIDDRALINEKGTLLSSFNVSDFEPKFYSARTEIKGNKFLLEENNIEEYLGKKYTLNSRDDVFFIPTDEMPEDFSPIWEKPVEFEKTELELIDVFFYPDAERILNFYFVELPSGEKGMMYFWIGD